MKLEEKFQSITRAAMNWISWMHCNEGEMIPRSEQAVKSKLRLHRINAERFSERGNGIRMHGKRVERYARGVKREHDCFLMYGNASF